MPCLIFTGHPCAGKSTLAEKFRERALQHSSSSIKTVVIVNEQTACPDQTQLGCYESSYAEKSTRGALKSSFDRAVSSADDTTLVILDSLNYIKGYRYELFCISKQARERHGVVWVLNDANVAREWNRKRIQQEKEKQQESADTDTNTSSTYYTDELLQELIQRYEPPDDRNRWDKPLYRVDVRPVDSVTGDPALAQNLLSQSVYNMHSLSDAIGKGGTDADADASANATVSPEIAPPVTTKKPTFKRAVFKRPTKPAPTADDDTVIAANLPQPVTTSAPAPDTKQDDASGTKKVLSLEDRIDEILDSFLLNTKALKEGASTRQHVASDANVLHNVDSVTQQVCSSITVAQNKSTVSTGKLQITVRDKVLYLEFHRRLPLTELRRLRKQYIQWVGLHPPEDTTERGIAKSFLQYIETQR
jgi:protein KTI12